MFLSMQKPLIQRHDIVTDALVEVQKPRYRKVGIVRWLCSLVSVSFTLTLLGTFCVFEVTHVLMQESY